MKVSWCALGLATVLAGASPAREIEDILKGKGIITDTEAMEGKAAKEKAGAPALPPLPDWVNKVKLGGDVRVRNEAFFRDGDPDRVRQRLRFRLGAKAALTSETELGFKLASGGASDPISNNQTFTNVFTFKDINITNAYLKVSPAGTFGWSRPYLTLMGGKFDTPTWHATKLQFDGDLAPEGFFESLNLVSATSGFLPSVQVNLGQWVFQESSKRSDGALFAFQAFTAMAPSDAVQVNLAIGDFQYHKPSQIATARNSNADLVITNAVLLSDGTTVSGTKADPTKAGPNEDGNDAEGNPIEIQRFLSDFNVINFGGDVHIRTPSPRWPLRLFGDYVVNTEASGGDDSGFQVGAGIGPTKDPGDVNFSYAYQRLETDAVMSAFADSDFGRDGGTNSKGHILQANYMLPLKGLQLTSTAFIVEPIRNASGCSSELEYRWQFDLVGKF